MKIGNIGRLDPDLQRQGITGLTNGATMEKTVWNEFYGNPERLAYESKKLLAEFSEKKIEDTAEISLDDLPQGTERETIIRQRVNQSFFRAAVISAYNSKCCISGVALADLVEACHIVDWADNEINRTNPRNGLCLNPFFHKAYDKFLISITPDYDIVVSEKLLQSIEDEVSLDYIKQLIGNKINRPDRFLPQRELLDIHHNKYLSIQ